MTLDQILVALVVVGAVAYLALRFRAKSKSSCGDSCGCGAKKTPPTV
jgi:type IV secretory pathway TrbL component